MCHPPAPGYRYKAVEVQYLQGLENINQTLPEVGGACCW
jgi:hypothetical protein